MKHTLILLAALLLAPIAAPLAAQTAPQAQPQNWSEPPVVEPKYDGTLIPPPKGAVVLFDGKNASGWVAIPNKNDTNQSSQFIWKVENGYMEVVTPPGAREQRLAGTKESPITSGHLHIEWATPAQVKGTGQGRGNSGVFIEGFPELQVLDSFNNPTYFDGQAAAFYKNRPPLVSACRGPGLWQCYDIYLQRAKVARWDRFMRCIAGRLPVAFIPAWRRRRLAIRSRMVCTGMAGWEWRPPDSTKRAIITQPIGAIGMISAAAPWATGAVTH